MNQFLSDQTLPKANERAKRMRNLIAENLSAVPENSVK